MKLHPILQHALRQGVHPQIVHRVHQQAMAGAQNVFRQALQHRMMQKQMKHAARGK